MPPALEFWGLQFSSATCIELGKVSLDLIQRHCAVILRAYKDLRFFLYNKITSWVILIKSYLHHKRCFGGLVYREQERETPALHLLEVISKRFYAG